MTWDFIVEAKEEAQITSKPSSGGVYVRGTFLEGAGWNISGQCLKEPQPMELVCSMPVIHFKPIEPTKRKSKGLYQCPCYYYPSRSDSYVIAVDLRTGTVDADFWTKRGTALLLSLSN